MPTLNDVLAGSLAQAVQVQQIIDALKGTPNKGVPVSLVSLNDSTNYALTVQNDDPTNSRALLVLKSDGTTLIEADATGVTLGSPVNLPAGSINGGTALANASVTNAKLGPDVARANLLTNGGFEIWQRGFGPFGSGLANTTDRWASGTSGTDTMSISRDTSNVDIGSGAAAAVTFVLGTGAGQSAVYQIVKPSDGYALVGKTISLSIRVRTGTSGACTVSIGNQSGFQSTSGFHSGNGTYATLSATYTVQASDTLLTLGVRFAVSCTAYLDNACLVVGSQPADYVPLHPADDMARCQRYYEVLGGDATGSLVVSGIASGAGGPGRASFRFRTQKAVSPTVTKNGTWTVGNAAQPTIQLPSIDGFYLSTTSVGAGDFYALNQGAACNITAEANP